jgi:hypothetical protein
MIFQTILFTPVGQDPHRNEYIYCAMIWLKSLFRSGTLQLGDRVVIMTEAETAKRLREISIFRHALVELRICLPPRDVREGMNLKYLYRPDDRDADTVVVYSDTDQIFTRTFRPELSPDTILLNPEGPPTDSNYAGDYDLSGAAAGFSAGLFAYHYGPRVQALLDTVLQLCKGGGKKYYTLDQPHYNKALRDSPVNRAYLAPGVVSFNGHNAASNTHIYNMAGSPGDGPFHLQKMLDAWLAMA